MNNNNNNKSSYVFRNIKLSGYYLVHRRIVFHVGLMILSHLYLRGVLSSIKEYGQPPPGSQPLKFDTIYSQNTMAQFLKCLWKQNLVYWRSPPYNAMRIFFTIICALIFGTVFWNIGTKRYAFFIIPYAIRRSILSMKTKAKVFMIIMSLNVL